MRGVYKTLAIVRGVSANFTPSLCGRFKCLKEASQEGNSGRRVLANLSTVVVTNHSTIRAGLGRD